jgi:hypothetical protein
MTPIHPVRAEQGDASRKARLQLNERNRIGDVVSFIRRLEAAARRSPPAVSTSQAVSAKYAHLAKVESDGDRTRRSILHPYGEPPRSPLVSRRDRSVNRSRSSLIARLTDLAKLVGQNEKWAREARISEQAIESSRRAGGPVFLEGQKPGDATHQRTTLIDRAADAAAKSVRPFRQQLSGRTSNAQSYLGNDRLTPISSRRAGYAHSFQLFSALANELRRSLSKSLIEPVSSFRRGSPQLNTMMKVGSSHMHDGSETSLEAPVGHYLGVVTDRSIRLGATGSKTNVSFSRLGRDTSDFRNDSQEHLKPSRAASSASDLIRRLRAQQSSGPAEPVASRSTGPSSRAGEFPPPLIVNFSPTIVLQGKMERGNLERTVVQAIRLHSHELVQIINRELDTQSRAAF